MKSNSALTAGLEIHQQLASAKKLFCNCPTTFAEKPLDLEVVRRLRAVSGETGEVDQAARYEARQGKAFRYRIYPTESCLVETDSEPPHNLNPEALDIALEIALLLHCTVPAEIHVMRKNVIDGSNTSGFQRTALVGLHGWIETASGRVGILSVAIEEDSAQILAPGTFGLNRLGIPLVEISTAPDIRTSEHGREVAEALGMLLRSSRVRRGLGTIRQDLNVSVPGGSRVEIKGVQDLKGIPLLIESEAARQRALIAAGEQVANEVRKANPDGTTSFLRPLPGAARLYPETDAVPIRVSPERLASIQKHLPELLGNKRARLSKELGVGEDVITSLERAGKLDLFRSVPREHAPFAAHVLLSYEADLRKRGADPARVREADFQAVFSRLAKGDLIKDAVMDTLADIASGKKAEAAPAARVDVAKEVAALLKKKPGLSFGAYMGILMGTLKGRVSGDEIAKALKKAMG
ncbi:MAG: hypothetical protein HY369_03520 [Candidatus Aenigmarchaeota archaeon]|nr:hypothetical protein [Candidatus Aenigmarchaeota archaeon]